MQAASNRKGMGRVIAEHAASYSDPITMRANEELTMSDKEDNWHGWTWIWCTNQAGKSGWVPKKYVERHEDKGIAHYDYDAIELSVHIGEEVLVAQFESGWLWCSNQQGRSGWVPAENIAMLPQ